jgi:hypothetical protein
MQYLRAAVPSGPSVAMWIAVLDCVLDPVLEIGGQRPVLVSQAAPQDIEVAVEPKRSGVCAVAEHRQPARVLDDGVKYVAMQHQ